MKGDKHGSRSLQYDHLWHQSGYIFQQVTVRKKPSGMFKSQHPLMLLKSKSGFIHGMPLATA